MGEKPNDKSGITLLFEKKYNEKNVLYIHEYTIGEHKIYKKIDKNKKFLKIVEEKDATPEEKLIKEINSGVYILRCEYLFDALKEVSNKNSQGEYYLTDIIDILRKQGLQVGAFAGAKFEELQGINSPDDLERAEKYYSVIPANAGISIV